MSVTDNSNTIRLILEVTRVEDDSFAISLEDEHFGDSDERFVSGLTEGEIFDAAEAAVWAGRVVGDYLGEPESQGAAPVIERIAKPTEFKANP